MTTKFFVPVALLLASQIPAQFVTVLQGKGVSALSPNSVVLEAEWADPAHPHNSPTNDPHVNWSGNGCQQSTNGQEVWLRSTTSNNWVEFLPTQTGTVRSALVQMNGDYNDGPAEIRVKVSGSSVFTAAGVVQCRNMGQHYVYIHCLRGISAVRIARIGAGPNTDVAINYCAFEGPVRTFCTACTSSGPYAPDNFATGELFVDAPSSSHHVDIQVAWAQPGSFCFLVLGLGQVPSWPLPGCGSLCVSPDVVVMLQAGPGGTAGYQWPGNSNPALAGLSLYTQWVGFDSFVPMQFWSTKAMQLLLTN